MGTPKLPEILPHCCEIFTWFSLLLCLCRQVRVVALETQGKPSGAFDRTVKLNSPISLCPPWDSPRSSSCGAEHLQP